MLYAICYRGINELFRVRNLSRTSLFSSVKIVQVGSTLGSTATLWALEPGFPMTISVVRCPSYKVPNGIRTETCKMDTFSSFTRVTIASIKKLEIWIAWSRKCQGLASLKYFLIRKINDTIIPIPPFLHWFWNNKCVRIQSRFVFIVAHDLSCWLSSWLSSWRIAWLSH